MSLGLDPGQRPALRSAHEYARDALRLAILRGSAPAGTRLVQTEVAETLGISTTPVREALRDLATEGLVDFDAHRGAVVRQLHTEDFADIHALMLLLDPEAVRLAAEASGAGSLTVSATVSGLDEAEELADRMEAEDDVASWVLLNLRFHAALVADVARPRLLGILAGLRDTVAPYTAIALRRPGYPLATANRQHRLLLGAVRSGDPETAARISVEHADLTALWLDRAKDASSAADR